ncbi:H-NS family nucleoid-associated regulatory protein [Ralstonia pseudosolanacearum]|uniref:H-NS histone family protein n=1 Tax=Ralstonia pseudosolanacearum TaxID=1310165 RepID=UPI003CFB5C25
MAKSYKELLAEKEKLEAQVEEARQAEMNTVIEQIRTVMAEYGITVEQISGKRARKKSGPVPPKYRDPKTGATWSGRGRAPGWIGKNAEKFLIKD